MTAIARLGIASRFARRLVVVSLAMAGASTVPAQSTAMAITNVTLIDGTGAGPRVVSVIIEGDRITTRSAAEFLGRLPEEGTVEVGKKANLVLLEANPLTDIANTRKVAAVVLRGRFISAEELQRHR